MLRKIFIFIVLALLLICGHPSFVYGPDAKAKPVPEPEIFIEPVQKEYPTPPPAPVYEDVICTDDCPLIDPDNPI